MRIRMAAGVALLPAAAVLFLSAGALARDRNLAPATDNTIRGAGADAADPPPQNEASGSGIDRNLPLPPAPDNVSKEGDPEAAADDHGAAPAGEASDLPDSPAEPADEAPPPTVADPLEPVNRAIFTFNDKAYFWVMKPVAQGYRAVIPEGARVSVRNFFSNLGTPVRLANNLLQGKFKGAGAEALRFLINSTIGIGGLFDPAGANFHIEKRDEDLGQTLGRYGLGHGLYIVLPLLGPSSARDTVGLAGDLFADPVTYVEDPWAEAGIRAGKAENELSLSIGDYEDVIQSTLDPYVAIRDAYVQNRAKRVRE